MSRFKYPKILNEEDLRVYKIKSVADCVVLILAYTGLRASEFGSFIEKCKYEIHIKPKYVEIIGKRMVERNIYVPVFLWSVIEIYLSKNPKTSRYTVWRHVKKYAVEHGIQKNIYPHMLRHTYATKLFRSSVDLKNIQVLLGHKSIRTTADIYIHPEPDLLFHISNMITYL